MTSTVQTFGLKERPGVVVCLIYNERYQYEVAALQGRYESDRLSSNSITA